MTESRPLRVLVLRPEHQAGRLAAALRRFGLQPVIVPAVEIVPGDRGAIADAARRLEEFDWVVFTSLNGVAAFFEAVQAADLKPHFPGVAAVGPATAQDLRRRGVDVRWIPSAFTTAAIGQELPGSAGEKVCLVRAAVAGDDLEGSLRKRGFVVERVDAYTTRPVNPRALAQAASEVDAVAFTSASIVKSFADSGAALGQGVLVFSIGPATTGACLAAGLRVDGQARRHTIDGLVDAIVQRMLHGAETQ